MRKSSLIPLALIISVFLILPIAFWFINSKNSNENVQGVKTRSDVKGVIVKVYSNYGTWDMAKYICKTKEECLSSLVSGKNLDTTSGGVVEEHFVTIEYSQDWNNYEFLKVFVKPGWGSQTRTFKTSVLGGVSGVSVNRVSSGGANYDVILIQLNNIGGELLEAASFSDQ